MESCTLLLAFLLLAAKKSPNNRLIFLFYSLLTSFLIAAIFYWKIFPICFVEGKGLTDFKIYSEYVICIIIVSSIVLLINNNKEFESSVYKSILFSMIFTIISELAFTFYVDNYGISNLIGHYFKLSERDIKESKVTITLSSGDGTAVVIVADNAGGVPEESISKVFDPYFTTKGPQRGTGVGLFMAKTIIEKNMGGRLSVRNGDDGAEFRIEV